MLSDILVINTTITYHPNSSKRLSKDLAHINQEYLLRVIYIQWGMKLATPTIFATITTPLRSGMLFL